MFKYLAAAAGGFMLGGGVLLAILFMIAVAIASTVTSNTSKFNK